jgi:Mlc titration factor MtfA (ptsG expression regulator)
MGTSIGIVLIGAAILVALYNLVGIVRAIFKYFFGDSINKYLLLPGIEPGYKRSLSQYSGYYRGLNAEHKKDFEKRVQRFINSKQFIPRGFKKVTEEMKALIAGSAIQLTFGLPDINLAHFSKILIYTDTYYSTIHNRYHEGEVNVGGIIVLSWRNFVNGYMVQHDSRNLGLHEMAHALRLENAIHNDEYDFLDAPTLAQWSKASNKEMTRIREGLGDFFRDYAMTNQEEFFAVAVEAFFERSMDFRQYKPELYRLLAKLLNQDPVELLDMTQLQYNHTLRRNAHS